MPSYTLEWTTFRSSGWQGRTKVFEATDDEAAAQSAVRDWQRLKQDDPCIREPRLACVREIEIANGEKERRFVYIDCRSSPTGI